MRAPLFIAGLMAVLALGIATTHAATDTSKLVSERLAALEQGLDDAQKQKLNMAFDDDARMGFNFLPGDRKGLTLKDMNPAQREQTHAIVQAALSDRGFQKVQSIEARELILREMENNPTTRDPEKYTLGVFGTPGNDKPWALRWEGHHLSLNWTFAGGKIIASTPQFMGTNPGEVLDGPHKGDRPLAAEEDLGRSLVKSLDEAQKKACIINETAPPDVITKLDRQAQLQEDKGVAFNDLKADQKGLLQSIIAEVANVQAPELAEGRIAKIKDAGIDKVKFAWMGSIEKGQGHYYRVQGPTFIIEYDNTQNNANHVHLVWRDFKNDFGRDVLLEHYKAAANTAGQHVL